MMTRTREKPQTKTDFSHIAEQINKLIADNTVYYQKVRHYHWNVIGDNFFELHEAFEEEYEATAEVIDTLAERVRALGEIPLHTLEAMLNNTNLDEDESVPNQTDMIRRAADDLTRMVDEMYKVHHTTDEANDLGSSNMLEDLIEKTEKRIWMLRAFINEPAKK